MPDRAPDGRLEDWADLDEMGWESLLVGNGMSINVSSYFAYDSLYEEACKDFDGSLDDKDIAVFEEFGTTNFEVVLAKLRDGISLAGVLGRSRKPYRERFRSVQATLGEAVRRVHPNGLRFRLRRWPRSRRSCVAMTRSSARATTC